MKKIIKIILLVILAVILLFAGYLFIGSVKPAENIIWGVNFSQKHAEGLGLNWQEAYSALIDDLGVRNLKLAAYWDLLEKKEGQYDFSDLDWQIGKIRDAGGRAFFSYRHEDPQMA